MTFHRRGSSPITPIYNTKLPMVSKNMCNMFHQDILILVLTQVTACAGGRTDSHPDFNWYSYRDHLYYIYLYYIYLTWLFLGVCIIRWTKLLYSVAICCKSINIERAKGSKCQKQQNAWWNRQTMDANDDLNKFRIPTDRSCRKV